MLRPVHLLVCLHGLSSSPQTLSSLAHHALAGFSNKVGEDTLLKVFISQSNARDKSYDGLDWCAERVVAEIYEHINELEQAGTMQVARFSIVGWSTGGLVARYAIGILHHRRFFNRIQPVNFTTFASPHIGILRYPGIKSDLMSALGSRLLSRTGKHLYCMSTELWDASDTPRPLLEVMSNINSIFYEALLLFPHLSIYGNAIRDTTVPYCTACIEDHDPFMGHQASEIEIDFEPNYNWVIRSYTEQPSAGETSHAVSRWAWCKSTRDRIVSFHMVLPPELQFSFPMSIIFFLIFPFLVPLIAAVAVFRLWTSYLRVSRLESDAGGSLRSFLLSSKSEHGPETTAYTGELFGVPPGDQMIPSLPLQSFKAERYQPILTPAQRQMIVSLNSLPHLRKIRVFFQDMRYTHGMIIAVNPQKFPENKKGDSVLKHWWDQFVV